MGRRVPGNTSRWDAASCPICVLLSSRASRASFCELCRAEHATIGAEEAQFDTSNGSKRRGEAGTS